MHSNSVSSSWSLLIFTPPCSVNDTLISDKGSSYFGVFVPPVASRNNASGSTFLIPTLCVTLFLKSDTWGPQQPSCLVSSGILKIYCNASWFGHTVHLCHYEYKRIYRRAQTTARHSRFLVSQLCSDMISALDQHLSGLCVLSGCFRTKRNQFSYQI